MPSFNICFYVCKFLWEILTWQAIFYVMFIDSALNELILSSAYSALLSVQSHSWQPGKTVLEMTCYVSRGKISNCSVTYCCFSDRRTEISPVKQNLCHLSANVLLQRMNAEEDPANQGLRGKTVMERRSWKWRWWCLYCLYCKMQLKDRAQMQIHWRC